MIKFYSMVLD